jgi:hypothetical protein
MSIAELPRSDDEAISASSLFSDLFCFRHEKRTEKVGSHHRRLAVANLYSDSVWWGSAISLR